MQPFILISIFIFALLVLGALIVVIIAIRKSNTSLDPAEQGKHPKGYWMGIGPSFGFLLGYALAFIIGLFTDSMTFFIIIAPAIGAGLGVSIGSVLEWKYKDKIRPLTEQEQKMQKWGVALGLIMLLVGIFVFILILRMR